MSAGESRVCFGASRSRCYGYIFGNFLSVIRKWNQYSGKVFVCSFL